MAASSQFWLMKTEPGSFSIQDLAACPNQTTFWDGVRNYQARNFMRDQMRPGDRVLFYHSNADPSAIVGVAQVVSEAYPDYTAWDPGQKHFDPDASPENPIWQMVDIQLVEIFPQPLPLERLRNVPGLERMELLRKGSRLSVQPVRPEEFQMIVDLAHDNSDNNAQQPARLSDLPVNTPGESAAQDLPVQAPVVPVPNAESPAGQRAARAVREGTRRALQKQGAAAKRAPKGAATKTARRKSAPAATARGKAAPARAAKKAAPKKKAAKKKAGLPAKAAKKSGLPVKAAKKKGAKKAAKKATPKKAAPKKAATKKAAKKAAKKKIRL